MIKKEYIHFFTRKYLLFLLPVLIFVLISGYMTFKNSGGNDESMYSHFSEYVDFYENREELQAQYDYYLQLYKSQEAVSDDDIAIGNNKDMLYKRVSILKFCLDNNLQFDQVIDGANVFTNGKYTTFNYLYSYTIAFVVFAIFACILLGSCYQTADTYKKTSIFVYTTGEKRNKIIDRKFLVSLSMLVGFSLIYYILVALFGLQFLKYSPKHLLYFLGEKLFDINYFEFFLIVLSSQTIMLVLTYTFIYYFAVAVKNPIIGLCTMFLLFAVSVFMTSILNKDICALKDFLQAGYIMLFNAEVYEIKYCLYFIPLIVAVIAMIVISKVISKKADYSR